MINEIKISGKNTILESVKVSDSFFISNLRNNTKINKYLSSQSQITLTEEDLMERKPKKYEGKPFPKNKFQKKKYNFSETSSEFKNKNYVGGDSSDTSPLKIDSDSINTSDVNVVSVDSVNGRRFL